MRRAGLIPLLCAVALAITAPLAAAEAWTIEQLMHALGKQRSGRASFVERKYLAILDAPVESSGELRFRAPDRLEKITLEPRAESLVLEGNTLTVVRGERRHIVQLSDYREIAAFIDSIRATLAGDRSALEQTYAPSLAGTSQDWTLTLLPREPKMAEVVLRITINGSHAQLRGIEILQADGDRSVMEIVAERAAR
ncbi:LolA family protein [Aromatoleum bremense]|uniref:Outer membrane lipoprotein carrier protein LolA n=1 Tax=Aromatoleum bremense TaxID=76115 RepID=A0ABX1NX56_9RHOO|nr:LolA-related protein [Aromatoleum bremense]NMG16216.1 outer membrane lipoprotein carrier protein LolA [Aromatoleum bremense]QTQ33382.1 Putative outer-membrane lipoprotein carrier protein [Aromatoleum bremense]